MNLSSPSSCPVDPDFALLTLPLASLSPADSRRAFREAQTLARATAREHYPCLVCAVSECRGRVTVPPQMFLQCVVERGLRLAAVSAETGRHWREAFDRGAAGHDPRVLAFCAALAERLMEIGHALTDQHRALAVFLNRAPTTLAVVGVTPSEQVIFGTDAGDRFLVVPRDEVPDRLHAAVGARLADVAGIDLAVANLLPFDRVAAFDLARERRAPETVWPHFPSPDAVVAWMVERDGRAAVLTHELVGTWRETVLDDHLFLRLVRPEG